MVSSSSTAVRVQCQYFVDSKVTVAVGHLLCPVPTVPTTEPLSMSSDAPVSGLDRVAVKFPVILSSSACDSVAVTSVVPLAKMNVPVTEVDGPNKPPSSHPVVAPTAIRTITSVDREESVLSMVRFVRVGQSTKHHSGQLYPRVGGGSMPCCRW